MSQLQEVARLHTDRKSSTPLLQIFAEIQTQRLLAQQRKSIASSVVDVGCRQRRLINGASLGCNFALPNMFLLLAQHFASRVWCWGHDHQTIVTPLKKQKRATWNLIYKLSIMKQTSSKHYSEEWPGGYKLVYTPIKNIIHI
jgi:hypothetical protein